MEFEASDRWGESRYLDVYQAEVTASARARWRWRLRWLAITLICTSFATALFAAGWAYGPGRPLHRQRVLPGEFELHDSLVVAWPLVALVGHEEMRELFADIVRAGQVNVEIVVLTTASESEEEVVEYLRARDIDPDDIKFIYAPAAMLWVRDYGPLTAKSFSGGVEIIDTIYHRGEDFREQDQVPTVMGASLRLPVIELPIVMENGNLLSNGAGLCVTTNKLLRANEKRGLDESSITRLLRERIGAEEVIYLEPLRGEPNGHVDMFMTFTGPDTVVVGQYDLSHDQINAAILDRNAERLARVKTACGPLRVHRIPMPKRIDGKWYTFTNVVYVNGTMLVPSYGEIHAVAEQTAVSLYQRLLPNWKIVSIDCSDVIIYDGLLHCATANIMTSVGRTRNATGHFTWGRTH